MYTCICVNVYMRVCIYVSIYTYIYASVRKCYSVSYSYTGLCFKSVPPDCSISYVPAIPRRRNWIATAKILTVTNVTSYLYLYVDPWRALAEAHSRLCEDGPYTPLPFLFHHSRGCMSQRVQLECHYGIRSQKPYHLWF